MQDNFNCLSCGIVLPDGAQFCPSCGTKQKPLTCVSCGESLPGSAKFCIGCGSAVGRSGVPRERPPISAVALGARFYDDVRDGFLDGFEQLLGDLESIDDVLQQVTDDRLGRTLEQGLRRVLRLAAEAAGAGNDLAVSRAYDEILARVQGERRVIESEVQAVHSAALRAKGAEKGFVDTVLSASKSERVRKAAAMGSVFGGFGAAAGAFLGGIFDQVDTEQEAARSTQTVIDGIERLQGLVSDLWDSVYDGLVEALSLAGVGAMTRREVADAVARYNELVGEAESCSDREPQAAIGLLRRARDLMPGEPYPIISIAAIQCFGLHDYQGALSTIGQLPPLRHSERGSVVAKHSIEATCSAASGDIDRARSLLAQSLNLAESLNLAPEARQQVLLHAAELEAEYGDRGSAYAALEAAASGGMPPVWALESDALVAAFGSDAIREFFEPEGKVLWAVDFGRDNCDIVLVNCAATELVIEKIYFKVARASGSPAYFTIEQPFELEANSYLRFERAVTVEAAAAMELNASVYLNIGHGVEVVQVPGVTFEAIRHMLAD